MRKAFESCFAVWNPPDSMPAVHWTLASWYRRILEASRAPAALFEAAYHACSAVETWFAQPKPTLEGYKQSLDRLNWATSLLRENSFLIQTQGYSRGSCRRLEYIRDDRCRAMDAALTAWSPTGKQKHISAAKTAVSLAVHKLRIKCTEIMRAIAREVGEDNRAYLRQQDLRTLLAGQPLTESHSVSTSGDLHTVCCSKAGKPDLRIQWVRWWRWNGMLGIASRSYHAAGSALYRSILSVIDPDALQNDRNGGIGLHVWVLPPFRNLSNG